MRDQSGPLQSLFHAVPLRRGPTLQTRGAVSGSKSFRSVPRNGDLYPVRATWLKDGQKVPLRKTLIADHQRAAVKPALSTESTGGS